VILPGFRTFGVDVFDYLEHQLDDASAATGSAPTTGLVYSVVKILRYLVL